MSHGSNIPPPPEMVRLGQNRWLEYNLQYDDPTQVFISKLSVDHFGIFPLVIDKNRPGWRKHQDQSDGSQVYHMAGTRMQVR